MPRFFRPRGVPEFVTPPREPSRRELPVTTEVASIKQKLALQAVKPRGERNPYLIDALLADLSAALRAATVPVIPGRE